MIFGVFVIPKALVGLILVDRWGRRPLLLASAVGMSIGSLLIGVSFTLQQMNVLPELIPIFVFVNILVYFGCFAFGIGGLPWVIMSEIFPINIKVSAGTIVALTSWTSGWFVSYAFNFMFEWSAQGLYFLYYFFINLDKTIYQKKLRVIFIKIHKSNIKLFKNRVRILTFVSNSFRCAKCAVGKYLLDSRFLQILLAFVFLFRLDD
jgi:MFS family permease